MSQGFLKMAWSANSRTPTRSSKLRLRTWTSTESSLARPRTWQTVLTNSSAGLVGLKCEPGSTGKMRVSAISGWVGASFWLARID